MYFISIVPGCALHLLLFLFPDLMLTRTVILADDFSLTSAQCIIKRQAIDNCETLGACHDIITCIEGISNPINVFI